MWGEPCAFTTGSPFFNSHGHFFFPFSSFIMLFLIVPHSLELVQFLGPFSKRGELRRPITFHPVVLSTNERHYYFVEGVESYRNMKSFLKNIALCLLATSSSIDIKGLASFLFFSTFFLHLMQKKRTPYNFFLHGGINARKSSPHVPQIDLFRNATLKTSFF